MTHRSNYGTVFRRFSPISPPKPGDSLVHGWVARSAEHS